MADEGGAAPIIIIKRVKKGGHGHHGGAWKVAYADFVTAMMAFFLLLWLLNAVTEEQLSGISNYFAPTAVSKSTSGSGGPLGGKTIGEGPMPDNTSSPSITTTLPPPTMGTSGENDNENAPQESDEEAAARHEEEQFEQAVETLRMAITSDPQLASMAQNILVDNTAEGLRIQLADAEGTAMFPSASSAMFEHTRRALAMVAKAVSKMPQKISISGNTDNVPFNDNGYTNWELSADRALASRRVLINAGIDEKRITKVVGRAATDPLFTEKPGDHRNRRIGIVLLREIGGADNSSESQPKPLAANPGTPRRR